MTTRESLTWKGMPPLPGLFGTQLYLAHQAGTPIEEMAEMLEAPVEWVRERVEAARLCLERQVEIAGPRPRTGPVRSSALFLLH